MPLRQPGDLLAARLAWERANPRSPSLVHAERMIVRGLTVYGFGRQSQVTRQDGFEIAVDDLIIRVEDRRAARYPQDAAAKAQFVDLVLGKGAVLWQNTADDPRTFEVRRDGKHVGFANVLESGEVVWL